MKVNWRQKMKKENNLLPIVEFTDLRHWIVHIDHCQNPKRVSSLFILRIATF